VIPFIATVNSEDVNDKLLPDLSKPNKSQGFVNYQKVKFAQDIGSNLTIVIEKFTKLDKITSKAVNCFVCLQIDV
jgi:hypothetical protein